MPFAGRFYPWRRDAAAGRHWRLDRADREGTVVRATAETLQTSAMKTAGGTVVLGETS